MTSEQHGEAFERRRTADAEVQFGGADAVEKTTYVVGEGTDPRARKGDRKAAGTASAPPGRLAIVIIVLVVLVALAYLLGMAA